MSEQDDEMQRNTLAQTKQEAEGFTFNQLLTFVLVIVSSFMGYELFELTTEIKVLTTKLQLRPQVVVMSESKLFEGVEDVNDMQLRVSQVGEAIRRLKEQGVLVINDDAVVISPPNLYITKKQVVSIQQFDGETINIMKEVNKTFESAKTNTSSETGLNNLPFNVEEF